MKQSFSITTSTGQHLHLISYYARSHPTAPNLNQPSTDPALRHIRPQKGLYPESTVNDQQNLPVVTRGPMAGATFSLSPHPMARYPQTAAEHTQVYDPYAPTPYFHWPPIVHRTTSYLPPLSGATAPSPYGHPPAIPAPPSHPPGPPAETTLPPPAHTNAASAPIYASRSPQPPPASHPTHGQRVNSPGHAAANPHVPQIDPRLMSPPSQPQHGDNRPSLTPGQSHLPPPTTSAANGREATTVPSLGSLMTGAAVLMNRASVPPYSKSVAAPSHESPNGLRHTDGPKDIPSEKIGFGGEDMRALRQLDRVFTA